MRSLFLAFVLITVFHCETARTAPMNSKIGHFYFGLGPNFNLRGNMRLGIGTVEIGLIQEAGLGVAYVHRTATPFFYQIGAILSNGGAVIGGGGMEWDTSSFFRFRTDVTVHTNKDFETTGYVSVGGVFIL